VDEKGAVEAALFSSSEKIGVPDIADRTGLSEGKIRQALKDLRKEYDDRESAIMIAKIGNEYKMMLRTEYTDFTGNSPRLR
jgi:segregation and condensation protein B